MADFRGVRFLPKSHQKSFISLKNRERENMARFTIPSVPVFFVVDAEPLLFCGRNCHLSKSYLSHEVNDSKEDG